MDLNFNRVKKVLAAVFMAAVFLQAGNSPAMAVSPLEEVKGTVEGILDLMRDDTLGSPEHREERRAMIMKKVDARFDFEEMSKRTLARAWRELNDEERKQFVKLFSELLKNNYIGRIEAYSDEVIDYPREIFDERKNTRAKVYTRILRNGGEIPINYILLQQGEGWLVYDVDIEGVSLVRNYRSEFARILDKEKFPGLIRRMQEKIAENKAERQER